MTVRQTQQIAITNEKKKQLKVRGKIRKSNILFSFGYFFFFFFQEMEARQKASRSTGQISVNLRCALSGSCGKVEEPRSVSIEGKRTKKRPRPLSADNWGFGIWPTRIWPHSFGTNPCKLAHRWRKSCARQTACVRFLKWAQHNKKTAEMWNRSLESTDGFFFLIPLKAHTKMHRNRDL